MYRAVCDVLRSSSIIVRRGRYRCPIGRTILSTRCNAQSNPQHKACVAVRSSKNLRGYDKAFGDPLRKKVNETATYRERKTGPVASDLHSLRQREFTARKRGTRITPQNRGLQLLLPLCRLHIVRVFQHVLKRIILGWDVR